MTEIVHPEKELCLEINASLGQVDEACRAVEDFLARQGLGEVQFDIMLGVREGLVNAVRHGARLMADQKVSLQITAQPEWIRIRVTDSGDGFDWRAANLSCPAVFQEGGRGICIMHHYFDMVSFNERGNEVVMIKNLAGNNEKSQPSGGAAI